MKKSKEIDTTLAAILSLAGVLVFFYGYFMVPGAREASTLLRVAPFLVMSVVLLLFAVLLKRVRRSDKLRAYQADVVVVLYQKEEPHVRFGPVDDEEVRKLNLVIDWEEKTWSVPGDEAIHKVGEFRLIGENPEPVMVLGVFNLQEVTGSA